MLHGGVIGFVHALAAFGKVTEKVFHNSKIGTETNTISIVENAMRARGNARALN